MDRGVLRAANQQIAARLGQDAALTFRPSEDGSGAQLMETSERVRPLCRLSAETMRTITDGGAAGEIAVTMLSVALARFAMGEDAGIRIARTLRRAA